MTYLFPLTPRGIGTPDVEALGSYIRRLAIAHSVSVNMVIKQCCKRYKLEVPGSRGRVSDLRSNGSLAVYVRPNNSTQWMLDVFGHAAGRDDLRSMTFMALGNALDRCVLTFSQYWRWCPVCMLEFEKSEEPGYFKLIWHLLDVTHCPEHAYKLRDQCAKCGAFQKGFNGNHPMTRCERCKTSLSHGIRASEKSDSWDIRGADLIELISSIANNPRLTFPADGARKILSQLFVGAWERGEQAKFCELVKDEYRRIMSGKAHITLAMLRRLSFKLGLKVSDIFMGDLHESTGVLDPAWFAQLPQDMLPRKRRKPRNHLKVLEKIMRRIKACPDPSPLQAIAKEMKVSVGYLHYHFPKLAEEITARYRVWKHKQQERNRKLASALALKYFGDSGACRSRKQLFREIRAKTGLPKNLLREEINTIYRQLYE